MVSMACLPCSFIDYLFRFGPQGLQAQLPLNVVFRFPRCHARRSPSVCLHASEGIDGLTAAPLLLGDLQALPLTGKLTDNRRFTYIDGLGDVPNGPLLSSHPVGGSCLVGCHLCRPSSD